MNKQDILNRLNIIDVRLNLIHKSVSAIRKQILDEVREK